jgi:uncharacterized membrane protein YedE/YeeE
MRGLRFVGLGAYFGFVLVKAEVVSWYRIQEMFRFESFHMFGVIGSAIAVAALGRLLLARRQRGASAVPEEGMPAGWRRYLYGGSLFGVGWALTGACPGPIAALIGGGVAGAGTLAYLLVFVAAIAGTWVYARLQARLPH